MARSAQQSAGGMTIWMIVFAALWLTSTVFLIILYTGQEELTAEAKRWEQAKNRCVSGSEERSLTTIQNASESGPTQVGILEQARRDTTTLATGNEDDDPTTVRAKRDKLFADVESSGVLARGAKLTDASLLGGAQKIFASLQGDHSKLQEMSKEVERLTAEVTRLEDLVSSQQAEFEKQAKLVNSKLKSVEEDRDAFRKSSEEALTKAQSQFQERDDQNTREITKERERVAQLEQDLVAVRNRLFAQSQVSGGNSSGPQLLATARESDGEVLRADAGEDIIYINRGKRHRVTLGLQFAVYNGDETIPSDGSSKARIEVVSVFDGTSECKIVDQKADQLIFEGDTIANPIYDPARAPKFLVRGDFDINRDGQIDKDGQALVKALVTEWGGEIVDELTATTDFVVLGREPRKPRADSGRSLTPEQSEAQARMQENWEAYRRTVSTASSLSVPMLTQDLFMNYLGFRGR
ncbi:MAG: hypothetical protein ACPGXK_07155 [Phycisphaerae bacterium]